MVVTPSSPVVGTFKDRSMAEQAIDALYNAGFTAEQIRYSAPGTSGSILSGLKSLFTGQSTSGASITNDLTSMGLSNEDAQYYSAEYNNGNTILAVTASGREQEALNTLHQYGAYNTSTINTSNNTQTETSSIQPPLDYNQHATFTPEPNAQEPSVTPDWATQQPADVHDQPADTTQQSTASNNYSTTSQVYQPEEVPTAQTLENEPTQTLRSGYSSTPEVVTGDTNTPSDTQETSSDNPYSDSQEIPASSSYSDTQETPSDSIYSGTQETPSASTHSNTLEIPASSSYSDTQETPSANAYSDTSETSSDPTYSNVQETPFVSNYSDTPEKSPDPIYSNVQETPSDSSHSEFTSDNIHADTTPEVQNTASDNVQTDTTAEPETAQSNNIPFNASESTVESSSPVASEAAPTSLTSASAGESINHEDELQKLQEQIQLIQQQLQDAKAQLQAAKEHEAQIQLIRERDQKLQSSRQQLQDLQDQLQATLAELNETHSRISQHP